MANKIGDAVIEIRADARRLKSDLGNVEKDVHIAGRKMSDSFSTAFGTILTGALLYKVIDFGKKSVESFSKQQDALAELTQQLGYNSVALNEQASALQKTTRFADEDITSAQARIAAFTKDEAQIKLLTAATLDFAAAKKVDLTTAGDLLSKTIGGEMNALGRYGVKVDAAAGSTKRLMQVVEGVASLYGGMAEAQGKTFSGRLEILKNKVDDLEEGIGGALVPTLEKVAGTFGDVADGAQKSEGFFKGVAVAGRILGSVFLVVRTSLIHVGTALGTIGAALYAMATAQFKLVPQIIAGGFNKIIDNGKSMVEDIGKMWKDLNEKMIIEPGKIKGGRSVSGLSDEQKKIAEKRAKENLDADLKYMEARDALVRDSIKKDFERNQQAIQDKLKMEIEAIRNRIKTEKLDKAAADKEIAAANLRATVENNQLIREQKQRDYEQELKDNEEQKKINENISEYINQSQEGIDKLKKDSLDNATKGAEQFSNTLSGGFGNAIMAGENLGEVIKNITAQLAGSVLQAGLFASIMSLIRPSGGGFLDFFGKALGFGAMSVAGNGTNISIPNINSNVSSNAFSMQNSFNDRNIVDEIRNLNNKINALASRPLVSNLYMNKKLVGRSISLQQYQDTNSNVKVY
jgi:hypothetical protein